MLGSGWTTQDRFTLRQDGQVGSVRYSIRGELIKVIDDFMQGFV